MKYSIPEISWHNRDPVLSVDFQPKAAKNDPLRLATGGTDSHVLIWYFTTDNGAVNVEVAADLTRHQKAVNVVRWSPSGEYLASGDDESIIFIWKQNTGKEPAPASNIDQVDEQYKESWVIHKTLRGHMEDVLDISWSLDSRQLASGSVDNKLLLWDVSRGRYTAILSDHKGFVQGVSWDPKGQLVASTSSDRTFRTFDLATKKVTSRSSKAVLPVPATSPFHNVMVRLYHDDTLQTFYRRLQFSPDGMLIAVPAGRIEPEQGKIDAKPMNAVYIYTRYSLKVPACILPCESAALATRWSPRVFAPRRAGPPPALPLPRRMLLAVATRGSVLLYDTQQKTPLALISNIHYTRLTDLTWSPDGRTLVASSTDGFCSVVTFAEGELGEELEDQKVPGGPEPMETDELLAEPLKSDEKVTKTEEPKEAKTKSVKSTPTIESFIKFKAPGDKSPSKAKPEQSKAKTPIKIDIFNEVAMPSWSDNSSQDIIKPKATPEPIIIEDSEDIKLVYEETEQNKSSDSQSPTAKPSISSDSKEIEIKSSPETKKRTECQSPTRKSLEIKEAESAVSPKTSKPNEGNSDFFKQAKVTDVSAAVANKVVASPKAPRRVSFVTLSSPKNSKKKC